MQVVRLPAGEDPNDWLAVHVVDFFNRINLIYGTVCETCSPAVCPTMSGGPKFEYLWQDGKTYKKPTPLPASEYIGEPTVCPTMRPKFGYLWQDGKTSKSPRHVAARFRGHSR